MNTFMASGRLTKDPEERMTQSGDVQSTFTLAIDRKFAKEPTADFIQFTCWGKRAEYINKHLKKGNRLSVTAQVQNNNYKAKDGTMHYGFSFIANDIEDFYDWNQKTSEPATSEAGYNDPTEEYYPEAVQQEIPF